MGAADSENVIIIGSGPAGYTAALYAARAELAPLVIEGFAWGGLLQQTTEVENFPGYPEGVTGPVMMQQLRDQAERFGARFVTDQATRVELASEPGGLHRVWVGDDRYAARSVILAMGAKANGSTSPARPVSRDGGVSRLRDVRRRLLQVPRNTWWSWAAATPRWRRRPSLQVRLAGHDAAPSRRLARIADHGRSGRITEQLDGSRPYVVEGGRRPRRAPLSGSRSSAHRDRESDATSNHRPVRRHRARAAVRVPWRLGRPRRKRLRRSTTRGARPRTPGVFAAGDLVDHTYRQAVTAAGTGCQAALDAEWYLRDTPALGWRRGAGHDLITIAAAQRSPRLQLDDGACAQAAV